MYELAIQPPFGFSEKKRREMFALGLLHDIGYNFTNVVEKLEHEKIGYEILKSTHFKYAKEVLAHGNPRTKYKSKELDLLNCGDMLVDMHGNRVSFVGRLADIKERHGEYSPAYQNSLLIVRDLTIKNIGVELSDKIGRENAFSKHALRMDSRGTLGNPYVYGA